MKLAIAAFVVFSLVCGKVHAADPFDSTAKGPIMLTCNGELVLPNSVQILEAQQKAAIYAAAHGGKVTCNVDQPDLVWTYNWPTSAAPPTCTSPQPPNETQPGTCPAGTTGNWTQSRSYTSAPYPTCWTASAWAPTTPPAGVCVPITGSAVLTWTPPTTNTDGSPLTSIAGYRIAYGTSPTNLPQFVDIGSVTTWTIGNLARGQTWYFVIVVKGASANSVPSNAASKAL